MGTKGTKITVDAPPPSRITITVSVDFDPSELKRWKEGSELHSKVAQRFLDEIENFDSTRAVTLYGQL